MKRTCITLAVAGLGLSAAAMGQVTNVSSPWLPGDVALGSADAVDPSMEQARNGEAIGNNATFQYVESMSFDNARALPHNARGNLLGLDYGDTAGGGELYNFATDGTSNATLLFQFNGTDVGTTTLARVNGVSVSPDNSTIAVVGDAGHIIFLEWDDGSSTGVAGDGVSASITDAWETDSGILLGTGSQGTAWLDNSTLIIARIEGGNARVSTIDNIDTSTNTTGALTDWLGTDPFNPIGPPGGSSLGSVSYVPSVSPYAYFLWSGFNAGVSETYLSIVDPATWTLVRQIDLSNSIGTGRECAVGPDGRLYMAEYPFGSASDGVSDMSVDVLDLDIDGTPGITMADVNLMTDNSSVDYYAGQNPNSYMGLDVAVSTDSTTPTGACCTATVTSGCFVTEQADCENPLTRIGTYNGDGTDCAGVHCGPPEGACCTGGTCQFVTEADCTALGGNYLGDGIPCTSGSCVGACCIDGVCSLTYEDDCLAQGGFYSGNGTDCSTVVCQGVCCLPDGTQILTDEGACYAAGGRYAGNGTLLNDQIICRKPGACQIGSACSIMLGEDCFTAGGVFLGEGTTCGSALPPDVIATDDFDSVRQATSFIANPDNSFDTPPGTFPSSSSDVFGIFNRDAGVFDFNDDTLSIYPPDTQGILFENKTDNVFAMQDTTNGDNPSPTGVVSASWTFDISGYTDVHVVIDAAAMGDYEADPTTGDAYDFSASIDGGASIPVFTSQIIEAEPGLAGEPHPIYEMESGKIVSSVKDPLALHHGDAAAVRTLIQNRFVRLASQNLGSGSTLTLTFNGQSNGSQEAVAFDNLTIIGDDGIANTCPCETDGDAAQVNVFDLLAYLSDWFPQNGMSGAGLSADFNNSGNVDVFDLLDFLSCWFPASAGDPCP